MNGAKVIARAWADPDYRERLLDNGTAAIRELGFGGPEGDNMVVVANTPSVHNVIVCTLCSCYPWPVLGLPPRWYKSPPYRARMVRGPRALLREMGCPSTTGSRSVCGIRPPKCGISYCRCGPKAPRAQRGRARRHRHSGLDDRRRRLLSDVRSVALADPDLPRSNGELTFDDPWQGRALAIAIALVERLDLQWDDFRRHLIAAIDADPDRPYWDSWALALDAFVAEHLPDAIPP